MYSCIKIQSIKTVLFDIIISEPFKDIKASRPDDDGDDDDLRSITLAFPLLCLAFFQRMMALKGSWQVYLTHKISKENLVPMSVMQNT